MEKDLSRGYLDWHQVGDRSRLSAPLSASRAHENEIALVSRRSESLGYILTGEDTDHAKVQKTSRQEFKLKAVRFTQTSGKADAHIARELGISDTRIHQ